MNTLALMAIANRLIASNPIEFDGFRIIETLEVLP